MAVGISRAIPCNPWRNTWTPNINEVVAMFKKIKNLVSALRVTNDEARQDVRILELSAETSVIPTGRAFIEIAHTYDMAACSITLDGDEWGRVKRGESLRVRGSRTRLNDGNRCWLWWEIEGGQSGRLTCEAHKDDGAVVSVYKGRLAHELVKESR